MYPKHPSGCVTLRYVIALSIVSVMLWVQQMDQRTWGGATWYVAAAEGLDALATAEEAVGWVNDFITRITEAHPRDT